MANTNDSATGQIVLRLIAWKLSGIARLLVNYDSEAPLTTEELCGLGMILETLAKEIEIEVNESSTSSDIRDK